MAYKDILNSKTIEKALWNTMLEVRKEMLKRVPVDTGNLRNSITIATNKKRERYGPIINAKAHLTREVVAPKIPNKIVIGTRVAYANAVEFGRSDMPNYPAQPFIRPSFDLVASKLSKSFLKFLKDTMLLDLKRNKVGTVVTGAKAK